MICNTDDRGWDGELPTGSKYNVGEADLAVELAKGVTTVYKFQGREAPLVIVSFVRNNPAREVGFLDVPSDPSLSGQSYVAVSRAKGKMIVLISESTFSTHPVFEAFMDTKGEGCLRV